MIHITGLRPRVDLLLLLNLLLNVLELVQNLVIDVADLLSEVLAYFEDHLHANIFVCLCAYLHLELVQHAVVQVLRRQVLQTQVRNRVRVVVREFHYQQHLQMVVR